MMKISISWEEMHLSVHLDRRDKDFYRFYWDDQQDMIDQKPSVVHNKLVNIGYFGNHCRKPDDDERKWVTRLLAQVLI